VVFSKIMGTEFISVEPENQKNLIRRAEIILENSRKLHCSPVLAVDEILRGNEVAVSGFLADVFDHVTGLNLPPLVKVASNNNNNNNNNLIQEKPFLIDDEGSREERGREIFFFFLVIFFFQSLNSGSIVWEFL
jgi:hypothetical protein